MVFSALLSWTSSSAHFHHPGDRMKLLFVNEPQGSLILQHFGENVKETTFLNGKATYLPCRGKFCWLGKLR